jgi:hypothetical protein
VNQAEFRRRSPVEKMRQRQLALIGGQGTFLVHQHHDERVPQPAADALQPARDRAGGNRENLTNLAMCQLLVERKLNQQPLRRHKETRPLKERAVGGLKRGAQASRSHSRKHAIDVAMINQWHVKPPETQPEMGRCMRSASRGRTVPPV